MLNEKFKLTLIHTGQHFDAKMSDVFFNQLTQNKTNDIMSWVVCTSIEHEIVLPDWEQSHVLLTNKQLFWDSSLIIENLDKSLEFYQQKCWIIKYFHYKRTQPFLEFKFGHKWEK